MKKIISLLITFFIFYLILFTSVQAASPTPTHTSISLTPTQPTNSAAINELKERIASRVAQLKLVEKRGVIGTVTEISDTQITLSDLQNNNRFVDVDELTKFSSPSAKGSFGISDISKGSKLGVFGLFNKQSRRLLARFVDVLTIPVSLHGVAVSVDAESYVFKLITEGGEQRLVDVEKMTKTLSYNKDSGLARAGFSKIKENERVIVIGLTDIRNKNHIIASRVLLFPEIPTNPKINVPKEALNPQETTIPSTGSGKKLTPINR